MTSKRAQQAQQSFNDRKAAQQNSMARAAQAANAASKREQDAAEAASYGRGSHGWKAI